MKNKISLSTLIVTFFGVGFCPIAPGTIGSLMAFPLYLAVNYSLIYLKGGVSSIASAELINSILVFFAALFLLGLWAVDQYMNRTGKMDPKEIVIDEIIGQSITICFIIFLMPYIGLDTVEKFVNAGISENTFICLNLFSAFLMFRIFDITKPWPINHIDQKYKNAFGVMLDDIIAAIFAVVVHYFVLYAIADQL